MSEATTRPGLRRRLSAVPRDMAVSPFASILSNILDRVPGAVAAALVDGEGETVDYAGRFDPFEIKVAAAHFRILLGEAGRLGGTGEASWLTVRAKRRSYCVQRAPEGYAIVLVLQKRGGFASCSAGLATAIASLAAEAGWEADPHFPWMAVEVSRDLRGRPVALHVEGVVMALDVLGTFPWGRTGRGFRVRTESGHELSLVREPKNHWYADERVHKLDAVPAPIPAWATPDPAPR